MFFINLVYGSIKRAVAISKTAERATAVHN